MQLGHQGMWLEMTTHVHIHEAVHWTCPTIHEAATEPALPYMRQQLKLPYHT